MNEHFVYGVDQLATTLIRLSVSDGHEGSVSCHEIEQVARNLGGSVLAHAIVLAMMQETTEEKT